MVLPNGNGRDIPAPFTDNHWFFVIKGQVLGIHSLVKWAFQFICNLLTNNRQNIIMGKWIRFYFRAQLPRFILCLWTDKTHSPALEFVHRIVELFIEREEVIINITIKRNCVGRSNKYNIIGCFSFSRLNKRLGEGLEKSSHHLSTQSIGLVFVGTNNTAISRRNPSFTIHNESTASNSMNHHIIIK